MEQVHQRLRVKFIESSFRGDDNSRTQTNIVVCMKH